MTAAVMFQGTGSDVGKSLVVAGLARAFTRRGLAVRPFKPQNMSNNAGVTADGGEIGRAQMLQARACGVAPSVHMNPVLLKPQSEKGAQVVVQGRVAGNAQARDYHAMKPTLLAAVRDSFARLERQADLVLVEGAGSPAEVNLRAGDIANMGFALAAGVPVVLVGDIERGGVIASIVGTMALLEDDERATVAAYLINKFRGDVSLFDGAIGILKDRTGLDCLGVVPHLAAPRRLPAEDAMALDSHGALARGERRAIKVAVPRLERIANFDDLDPLVAEPDVAVVLVAAGEAIPGDADLVLLPGSKSTMSDLRALKANGWLVDIAAHVRRGGAVVGLCGGYQMLGTSVADPEGIEGPAGSESGLGLLDVVTVLSGDKRLVATSGTAATGEMVRGYEMHMGVTSGADCARPLLRLESGEDGAVSADGRVMGSYLHGLFASDTFRAGFLGRLRARESSGIAFEAGVEAALDDLAAGLEAALDLDRILEIARAR
ncbi:MAG: cobyric acid synthase [Proteobacteria bacterium]|nr:cobyric acid synthase [Pseudomonadota bacterium]MDA0951579.1 cobyric acid synthase [Pseudomonadota bacterium]